MKDNIILKIIYLEDSVFFWMGMEEGGPLARRLYCVKTATAACAGSTSRRWHLQKQCPLVCVHWFWLLICFPAFLVMSCWAPKNARKQIMWCSRDEGFTESANATTTTRDGESAFCGIQRNPGGSGGPVGNSINSDHAP